MKTKVFLTGLALVALTMVGNAQNKKGPGTGVCDGTGPKVSVSATGEITIVADLPQGVQTPVPANIPGDGICTNVGVCDQDCINEVPIKDQIKLFDKIKAKDGTCVNK